MLAIGSTEIPNSVTANSFLSELCSTIDQLVSYLHLLKYPRACLSKQSYPYRINIKYRKSVYEHQMGMNLGRVWKGG